MTNIEWFSGIYAASVTPYHADGTPDLDALIEHTARLQAGGCSGVVIAGTTGEGLSLSVDERSAMFKAVSEAHPQLVVVAGTGANSLADTLTLTRNAFDAGCRGVLVVPPFYIRAMQQLDLPAYYSEILTQAIPDDGKLLFYHIPQISGMPIDRETITKLRDAFPNKAAGIKDSSTIPENAEMLCKSFDDFAVLVGDDKLLTPSLHWGGAGAITGLANLFPERLRAIYDGFQAGQPAEEDQRFLDAARDKLAQAGLAGPTAIKTLLHLRGDLPDASVRLPLRPATEAQRAQLVELFDMQAT